MAFVTSFLGATLTTRTTAPVGAVSKRNGAARVTMAAADMSKSVPFLEKPPKLNGTLPGDVGEVKHGRVCMLAMLGWVFPEAVYHLPNDMYSAVNPLDAPAMVGWGPMLQIFLGIAFIEAATWEKQFSGTAGGDFGFDPLGLAKSPAAKARMQLSEIKNGRLAMCAIGGAIHHSLITGKGLVEQINTGEWFSSAPIVTPF